MSKEETEMELPAQGDKAEAIRMKYCLENDQVYEDQDDDCTFRKEAGGKGDKFLCYEFWITEFDIISQSGKLYFMKRIKN